MDGGGAYHDYFRLHRCEIDVSLASKLMNWLVLLIPTFLYSLTVALV